MIPFILRSANIFNFLKGTIISEAKPSTILPLAGTDEFCGEVTYPSGW
jgi:hypothetical protein